MNGLFLKSIETENMKIKFLTVLSVVTILCLFVGGSVKAQANIIGKYITHETVADPESSSQKSDRYLEIKKGSIATLISKEGQKQTQHRTGRWNWDEAKNELSVKFSASEKNEMGFTYVFKKIGNNIELIHVLTQEGEGEIYSKTWKKL